MSFLKKYHDEIKQYGFYYFFSKLLPIKIKLHFDSIVKMISFAVFKRVRLKNTIVIESHNDFDSNGGAFYDWLISNHFNRKYKIVWLIRNKAPKNLPPKVVCVNINRTTFRKYYYLNTARFVLSCHSMLESSRENQISLYMDHGAISLKSVKKIYHIPKGVNYILMPSEFMEPILTNDYNVNLNYTQPVILGYPYQDILYSKERGDLYKLTNSEFKKVILWMPTFRKNKDGVRNDSKESEPLGIPIINNISEYNLLNELLNKNNSLLIIKIHPMQDLSVVKIKSLSNIIVLNGDSIKKFDIDNYRLMKDTDALISDYSSVAFDYLHIDRPIGYTLDDAKAYKLGFIVNPPEKLMAGEFIYNEDQLFKFINSVINGQDPHKDERHQLFDKCFKYHDGHSCKRIADFLQL